jgi:ABC-2 type transport system ATP-binding protein
MLSTHIMQEVEAICSRIIIINKGEIIANDQTGNIVSQANSQINTISVEFDRPVDLEKLETIQGVTKSAFVKGNIYLLQSNATTDIRGSVFRFAVDNDLTVLSQQKMEKSLEEVFHELTTSSSGSGIR